ncbi:hypothetical protein [Alkalicoccobacillus murimartini]|uniref:23S rRNA G2069 N7-methylase RlmK/C1962 C5-methylase RlmI n=1 Tax=Alkalicoccobacillus murimartini TaxID=171685 RepID=A0ABT9YLS1_9BACI|nr:hypothetical protein [Alkalicoccobacillus murimartini]MDQ0208441.1 23S rRNA G2069 N7-methylase RlmK/C1962 C5-methylase RlmI [Alkalicoccobacillus murimartini]
MFAEHKISRADGLTGYVVDEFNGVIHVIWENHQVEQYVSEQTEDLHW